MVPQISWLRLSSEVTPAGVGEIRAPHSLGPGPSLHGWGWRGPREIEWVLGALAGASTTSLGSARPQIEAADTALRGHFPSPGHLPPHTPWCSFKTCRGQVVSYVRGRGVVGRTGLSGRQDTPGQGPLGQRPFQSWGPFSGSALSQSLWEVAAPSRMRRGQRCSEASSPGSSSPGRWAG